MDGATIKVERFVKKEEEGRYLRIPFAVPADMEEFRISYDYDRSRSIIDIGLNDSLGAFIGWAGSDRKELLISERSSCPGFETVKLNPGNWQIILGAYHVPEEGIKVIYTIQFTEKRIRLLRGDTHMHSLVSDGSLSREQLKIIARTQGLDYICITDHNNYADNDRLFSDPDVTVIPGVEWTHYRGHLNLLGVKRPFRSFVANTADEMHAVLEEARGKGAVLSVNHPFCPNCGWHFGFDLSFDMVEIWNGSLAPAANLQCVSWWDNLLRKGRHIPIIGGSDFHRFEFGHVPALPCTFLYSRSRSAADILDAMKQGNGFVSISQTGPLIEYRNTEGRMILPGSEIKAGTDVTAVIQGTVREDQIEIMRNGREISLPCREGVTETIFSMPEQGYLRVSVWCRLSAVIVRVPVLISNPLYVREV